jgi:hypothetical protein
MTDADWLKDLRLDLGEGYSVAGIELGGSWAVFKVFDPNGRAWAFRLPRHLLDFARYIREIPNWLVPRPNYEVESLNRKLANSLGDQQFHLIVHIYDTLFHSVLESFYEAGQPRLDSIVEQNESALIVWRFLIQTPAISYRLENYATSAKDKRRRAWAEQALFELESLSPSDANLAPKTLLENPLVIWGGAISEGFFTKAELPEAIVAVKKHLLALPDQQGLTFVSQMQALMIALHSVEGLAPPPRLALFCDATGFFEEAFSTEEHRTAPDNFGALLEGVKRMN